MSVTGLYRGFSKGRHLVMQRQRLLHQTHRHRRTGTFAQTQTQLYQRLAIQRSQ